MSDQSRYKVSFFILTFSKKFNIIFRYLATCSADKTIKLYSLDHEKGYVFNKTLFGNIFSIIINNLSLGHSKWVWDCAFSCDSDFLISVSTDGTAKIWQTDTGEAIKTLKGHKKGVNCLALNDT